MKRVLLTSTYGGFFSKFEQDNILIWKMLGYKVYIAANFSDAKCNLHTDEILKMGIEIIDVPFERSPFSRKTIYNLKSIKRLIKIIDPDIIDCHLAVVGVLVRLACWNNHKTKIIYSPHGFFFYKGCPFFNSIVYRTVEYLMAFKTDALITINKEDYVNAKKMHVRGKVHYVPGVGVETKNFVESEISIRDELRLSSNDILVISVGEINKNKNHIVVLEALSKLINSGNDNVHYVVCGQGELENKLLDIAKELKIMNNVHLLGFREDVEAINKKADIFVSSSFKEGLSVSIIEAMGAGLPVVASRIRGNTDLIVEDKGGCLFNPNNPTELYEQLKLLVTSKEIRLSMGHFNVEKSTEFSLDTVHKVMEGIYREVIK